MGSLVTLDPPERLLAAMGAIATPAYVVDMALLTQNLERASLVRSQVPCRMLLATKAFALRALFPLMREHLDGTCASGLFEARLGREHFGKEVHVFTPAYTQAGLCALLDIADHVYFNSPAQLEKFLPLVGSAGRPLRVGVRIRPLYSKVTVGGDLYDPCSPRSRFGVPRERLDDLPWECIDILHVHALCEALHDGSTDLVRHVADTFAPYVRRVSAVNFGGGHLFNKKGYDINALVEALRSFRETFGVDVILEPGGAVVVDAGYLVSTVLDVVGAQVPIAVLDTSAACHMPDVLEAPYRPPVFGSGDAGELEHTYLLAGNTCMAGDIIGEYSFERPLRPGDRIVFGDMLQYSFVKNTTFNGMPLPDIGILHEDGRYEVVRRFGYEDFAARL